MTRKQLSKVCSKAADEIERHGFVKESYGTKDGPKCALGALRCAHHGDPTKPLPTEQLHSLFHATRPRSRRTFITDFNDAPRTRKHDVIELLRDMAAKAAGEP